MNLERLYSIYHILPDHFTQLKQNANNLQRLILERRGNGIHPVFQESEDEVFHAPNGESRITVWGSSCSPDQYTLIFHSHDVSIGLKMLPRPIQYTDGDELKVIPSGTHVGKVDFQPNCKRNFAAFNTVDALDKLMKGLEDFFSYMEYPDKKLPYPKPDLLYIHTNEHMGKFVIRRLGFLKALNSEGVTGIVAVGEFNTVQTTFQGLNKKHGDKIASSVQRGCQ